MIKAKTILDMIEQFPAKEMASFEVWQRHLEINARVYFYMNQNEHRYYGTVDNYCTGVAITFNGGSKGLAARHRDYCSSRDALKSIRPQGWSLSLTPNVCVFTKDGDVVEVLKSDDRGDVSIFRTVRSKWNLPTEELSELHAVIQAIEHERALK